MGRQQWQQQQCWQRQRELLAPFQLVAAQEADNSRAW
jgi:hypothetical protein